MGVMRGRARGRVLVVLAVLLALGTLGPASARGVRLAPTRPAVLLAGQKPTYPKLDSNLNRVVAGIDSGLASREAARDVPSTADGLVTVRVELDRTADAAALVAYLLQRGAGQVAARDDVIEANVPATALASLSQQPQVESVRSTPPPVGDVVSQGAAIHGAQSWNAGGYLGTGVKVGVIDVGFTGLDALLGTELPANVSGLCYRLIGLASNDLADCELRDRHGAAVAETLVDLAPGVELYISNPQTPFDLNQAVTWMISQGVSVINHSVDWGFDGPGDGVSRFSDSPLVAVDKAVANGVTWVNSAGNNGLSTWSGTWIDADFDGWAEFAPEQERDTVYLTAGQLSVIQLRWDDTWGSAQHDVDLFLYDGADQVIRSSTDVQNGQPGQDPYEWFAFTPQVSGAYQIGIQLVSGGVPRWAQVQAFTGEALTYRTASYSIGNPAESANPGLLAVGAAYWGTPDLIEAFSANGPTRDGRTKPDIVGVDGADTATLGAFYGTSQASPHVAALAALVHQRFPAKSPADIASYLRFHATPQGGQSPNNVWGAGLALLPAVAANDNPFPSARTLSPTTAAVGSSEITVTVSGVDFVESSVVRWGGVDRPTVVVDSTTLLATISAADLSTPGIKLITVFTPGPGGGVSTPLAFSVASEHPDFDAPEFESTWARTDQPVAEGPSRAPGCGGRSRFTAACSRRTPKRPGAAHGPVFRQEPHGDYHRSRRSIRPASGTSPTACFRRTDHRPDATGRRHLRSSDLPAAGQRGRRRRRPGRPDLRHLHAAARRRRRPPMAPLITQRVDRDGTVTDDPTLEPYGMYGRLSRSGAGHRPPGRVAVLGFHELDRDWSSRTATS